MSADEDSTDPAGPFVGFHGELTDLVVTRTVSEEQLERLEAQVATLELLDRLTLELQRAARPQTVLDSLATSLVGHVADVCIAAEPRSSTAPFYADHGSSAGRDQELLAAMLELVGLVDGVDRAPPSPWQQVRGGSGLLVDRIHAAELEAALGVELTLLRAIGDVSMVVVPWSRSSQFQGAVVVVRNLQQRPQFTEDDLQLVQQVVDRHAEVYATRQAQVGAASNQRFRALVAHAPIGILQFDQHGSCVYVNAAWSDVSGLGDEDSLGDGWRRSLPSATVESVVASWDRLEPGGAPALESCWLSGAGATRRAVSLASIGEWDETERRTGTIVAVIDETARRVAEERLRRQAGDDPLTGLSNRRRLFEVLARRLADPAPDSYLVVVYVDLDRFKQVNDLLGHEAGDRVLREVARRLRAATRPTDVVARVGGDEFVLLLELDDLEAVEDRVEEVRRVLSDQVASTGLRLAVGGSVGVVVVDAAEDGLDADTVIGRADAAMYEAKAAGANQMVVFNETHRSLERDRREVERELERALADDRVDVAYLPVVDLVSGRVVGVEALARLQAPAGGVLEPGRFIEVAEQTGLIVDLGEAVLSRAFIDFGRWAEVHRDLLFTVNLSGRQLGQPGVVDRLVAALERVGLQPSRLCVELSEVALVDLLEGLGAAVERLRAAGVRLALDDFGTAYSSLSRIRDLQVDAVKVDATFVRRAPHDPVDAVVVAAAVQLAESLGIDVVAEGIEGPEELATVRRLGCRFGQGFLFGRPARAGQVATVFGRTFVTGP